MEEPAWYCGDPWAPFLSPPMASDAMPCHAVPSHAMPCRAIPSRPVPFPVGAARQRASGGSRSSCCRSREPCRCAGRAGGRLPSLLHLRSARPRQPLRAAGPSGSGRRPDRPGGSPAAPAPYSRPADRRCGHPPGWGEGLRGASRAAPARIPRFGPPGARRDGDAPRGGCGYPAPQRLPCALGCRGRSAVRC